MEGGDTSSADSGTTTSGEVAAGGPSESNSFLQQYKFDALGPIIINTDGTMARIPNWETLTEGEQLKALRLIAKRNQLRKAELLEQQKSGAAATGAQTAAGDARQDDASVDDEASDSGEILALEN
jgi:hypothetical protein